MKFFAWGLLATIAFSLAPVFAHEEHEHEHGHEHEHEHEQGHEHVHEHAHGAAVTVSAAAQKTLGLKTVPLARRRVTATFALPGRFELAPDARFATVAPAPGRIHIKVKALGTVKRGDVLFEIESFDLAAKDREIAVLEKRLAAYKEVGLSNAELASQLDVKRSERTAFVGDAEIRGTTLVVRASADGLVERLETNEGAQVEAGATIVTGLHPDRIRLRAFVTPGELARLTVGQEALCKGATGRLAFGYGEATDVYVEFPDGAPQARPGERASADCVLDASAPESFAVPTAAIVRNGLDPVVFVRDEHDADTFLAVPVVPGASGSGWTAITGLDDPDAEVVTDGVYELKLALAAQSGNKKAAGHFHADGTFHEGED